MQLTNLCLRFSFFSSLALTMLIRENKGCAQFPITDKKKIFPFGTMTKGG
jgi:hypothetical protein